ncbi:MAG: sigma-70 family RNA polymerase sigma factor [Gammaproteobacteria bacterium]
MSADYQEPDLAAIRSDKNAAFADLIRLHHQALLAAVRPMLDASHVDEIVQRAWIKAYNAIEKFEGRSSIKTWLIRIAINEVHMHHREQRRDVSLEQMDVAGEEPMAWRFKAGGRWSKPPAEWLESAPDELLMRQELLDCIEKTLAGMPVNQRSLLQLRDIEQLSFDDICNELGISASNARVLLHRARTYLYQFLDNYEETGEC